MCKLRTTSAIHRFNRSNPPASAAFALRPRHGHRPVRLPRLAAVGRERLLPARRLRTFVPPDEADADGPPLERVVAEKEAGLAVEPAEDRRFKHAAPAVDPIDGPLLRLRIEEAEGHADEAGPEVGPELVLVAEAAEQGTGATGRLALIPLRRALEPLAETPV